MPTHSYHLAVMLTSTFLLFSSPGYCDQNGKIGKSSVGYSRISVTIPHKTWQATATVRSAASVKNTSCLYSNAGNSVFKASIPDLDSLSRAESWYAGFHGNSNARKLKKNSSLYLSTSDLNQPLLCMQAVSKNFTTRTMRRRQQVSSGLLPVLVEPL